MPILQGDRADCRSAATEKRAERAGFSRGGNHARKKRNQFLTKRLMKLIGKGAAQILVSTRRESSGDGTGVGTAFHRGRSIDFRRQNFSRVCCGNLQFGNQGDKIKSRGTSTGGPLP